MCNRRTAFGAEDSVNSFAGAAHAGPAFGRPLDLDFGLGHHYNQGCNIVSLQLRKWSPDRAVRDARLRCRELLTVGGATLALAVIAMVVTREQGLVDINAVCHSLTQTMTGENHLDANADWLARES